MGKATIVGGGLDGLYTVDLDYGTADVDSQIAALQEIVASETAVLGMLSSELTAAQLVVNAATSVVDANIDLYRADNSLLADVAAATVELQKAAMARDEVRRRIGLHESRKSNALAEIARLETEPLVTRTEAWCCTFTEDGTGAVGTIEVNGEKPEAILVPECRPWAAGDGDLRDRLAMSAPTTVLNAMLLPGWQKHSPTYRIGTITAIDYDADTCSVILDPAESSAQSLDINRFDALADVPIEYLECNATPFDVDDRVVVQFVDRTWEGQTKVIGFESNPKPCAPWLWAGVNDDISGMPVKRVAKINYETLSVEETYVSGLLQSMGMERWDADTPLTRAINGHIVDPRDGTVYWSPDHSHSASGYGAGVQFSCNRRGGRMLNALYGNPFVPDPVNDGDRLYTWPEGELIKVMDDPSKILYGRKFDNGNMTAINTDGRQFMFCSTQFPGVSYTAFALYDRDGNHYAAGAVGGIQQYPPRGAAMDTRYAVGIVDQFPDGPTAYLIDVNDGSLLQTLTLGFQAWGASIRGDYLFTLENDYDAGSTTMTLRRYNLPSLSLAGSVVVPWPSTISSLEDLGSVA